MKPQFFLPALIATISFAGPVGSQPDMLPRAPKTEAVLGQSYAVRVENSMNINLSSPPNASAEDQIMMIEATKRTLYQTIVKGCDTLKQVLKGECFLKNIRINSNTQNRGNSGEITSLNVGASYEVTYRPD